MTNNILPSFTIDFINYHTSPLVYDSYERLDNNKLKIYLVYPDDMEYASWFITDYPFDHDIFIQDFLEYLENEDN